MRISNFLAALTAAHGLSAATLSGSSKRIAAGVLEKRSPLGIAPKVFIIDMFPPEAESWYGIPQFDLLAHNITVPGFSPLYPDVHCTEDYEICQLVTGEAEINAAATMTALVFSPVFDLRLTYFLIAGIAGINPKVGTLGSVTFARFDVQVALQYEFDPRDLPANFSTGYIPQGSVVPNEYPQSIYGTEVFELNVALRNAAMALVSSANVTLNDSSDAVAYRALYTTESGNAYAAGAAAPSVIACDGATSDVYFSGASLGETFENYTHLVTNGSGVYCATMQEDNASLEALLRGAVANKTDFSRIIAMRTASDFDRPPPEVSAYDNLLYADQGGFEPAINNIPIAGVPIVQGIVDGWDSIYREGINATNYIGDIFGTLGGTPDFGPVASNDNPVKRDAMSSKSFRRKAWSQRAAQRTRRGMKGVMPMPMPMPRIT